MEDLLCPCGCDMTHLMGVRQFGGPSIDLAFDCEACGERFVLRFYQHEGSTQRSVLAWWDLHDAERGLFAPAAGYPYPPIPPLMTSAVEENGTRHSGGW